MDISVVFSADTGRYVTNVANADKATQKAAESVAAAKNKILDSLKQQTVGAQKLGASFQDLQRINDKAASALASVTESNAKKIIASLDRISEKNRRVAQELQNLPKLTPPPAESAGHGLSARQAASATLMPLRDGRFSLRSDEAFLSSIPGVATAIQGLMPLIGSAGLAGLFVEMGEKGYEAFKKVQNAASDTRNAFQALHDESAVRIDDLELENQRIQDQIDKVSGHPNNGLATALLEAKKMADALVVSLQEDRKQLQELLKEHSVGAFGSLLTGVAGTGKQDKELLADQSDLTSKLRDAALEFNAATAGVSDSKKLEAEAGKYKEKVHGIYQGQIDALLGEKKRLTTEQSKTTTITVASGVSTGLDALGMPSGQAAATKQIRTIDNSAKIADVSGRAKQLADAQREADLQSQIFTGNLDLGKVKQTKENTGLENKAQEAARRANEEKLKGMEDDLAQLKLNGSVTAKAEYDFWAQRIQAFTAGADAYGSAYKSILDKQVSLAGEGSRKFAEGIAKIKRGELQDGSDPERQAELARVTESVNRAYANSLKEVDRARDTNTDAQNEIAAIRSRAAATEEETRINEAAGRTITRQDAARQVAMLHAQQFNAQIVALNDKAKQVANASYLSDPEKASQLRSLGEQGANLDAQRQEAMAKLEYTINPPDASAAVAAKDALNELTDAFNDTAKQLKDVVGSALSSVNSSLLTELTTRHQHGYHNSPFRAAGVDIARSVTGAGLQKVEGMGLSALGLGDKHKPTGRAGDALHVIQDNAPQVNIPGIPSGMSDLASKSLGGDPSANQRSLFQAAFPNLFAPQHADASAAVQAAQQPLSDVSALANVGLPSGPSAGLSGDPTANQNSLFAAAFPTLYPAGGDDTQAFSAWNAAQGTASSGAGAADALAAMSQMYPSDANATPQFSTIQPNNSTSQMVGGLTGKAVSTILPLIPGFAEGTPPLSEDTLAWVGENGPELRYLSKGTGIVPNHQVGKFTGAGGHTIHFHPGSIDARGSSDPAATEAAVRRGVTTSVHTSLTAMAHGTAEQKRRTPGLAQR